MLDDELKLLADTRDQLIVEAGRWRNRAHALLRVASPGYQSKTGALASAGSVRRARAIAKRSVAHRTRSAADWQCRRSTALPRLSATPASSSARSELLRIRGCTHLLAIRGVGPIAAATISARRVASAASAVPSSPPTAAPRPCPPPAGVRSGTDSTRGGNRQLNCALYTIAMVQARWEPAARAYLDRKLAEGKSAAEA